MQARNQVGSSFKPYVLAAAVKQGMNVQTSILNGYSPLCVPPETQAMTLSKRGPASSCPSDGVGWLAVGYDPVVQGPVSVVKAAALSSNPAFEDLAHRVGTKPIIRLAKSFGVNIGHAPSSTYPHGDGSGLRDDVGKIGIALGIAPLTVEEQATTFATLADNGVYHTPHVIAKITRGGRECPAQDHHSHGPDARPGGRRGLGAVVRHGLRHGHAQRGPEPVAPDDRQDGHDGCRAVSLLYRRAPGRSTRSRSACSRNSQNNTPVARLWTACRSSAVPAAATAVPGRRPSGGST